MDTLQSYRNKRARIHVLAGALEFTAAPSVGAAIDAADERILARQVQPGETLLGSNGQPIPAGWYAIAEGDEHGLTLIAAEPTFFESVWEVDVPRPSTRNQS